MPEISICPLAQTFQKYLKQVGLTRCYNLIRKSALLKMFTEKSLITFSVYFSENVFKKIFLHVLSIYGSYCLSFSNLNFEGAH